MSFHESPKLQMNVKPEFLIAGQMSFYSYQDEWHFFHWLESIPDVEEVVGTPDGLRVILRGLPLSDDGLADLVSLMFRYNLNPRTLSSYVTDANRAWFADPRKYWHTAVFGE
jgi:hypothetical protein